MELLNQPKEEPPPPEPEEDAFAEGGGRGGEWLWCLARSELQDYSWRFSDLGLRVYTLEPAGGPTSLLLIRLNIPSLRRRIPHSFSLRYIAWCVGIGIPENCSVSCLEPWHVSANATTWRFMGSHKCAYQSPNMGHNYSYLTYNPTIIPMNLQINPNPSTPNPKPSTLSPKP